MVLGGRRHDVDVAVQEKGASAPGGRAPGSGNVRTSLVGPLDWRVTGQAGYLRVIYLPDVGVEVKLPQFLGNEALHEGLVAERTLAPDKTLQKLDLPLPVLVDLLQHPPSGFVHALPPLFMPA